jgi:hypothetical protein
MIMWLWLFVALCLFSSVVFLVVGRVKTGRWWRLQNDYASALEGKHLRDVWQGLAHDLKEQERMEVERVVREMAREREERSAA